MSEPSVEGNEVIFYEPSLDKFCYPDSDDLQYKIKVLYGSIELDMIHGRKIFKNHLNQTYKIEKFDPIIVRFVE